MVELKTYELCVKNQVEFMVQLVGTTRSTTTNTCKSQLAGFGFHVLTRRQTPFGPGFVSWHGGKLPYPCLSTWGWPIGLEQSSSLSALQRWGYNRLTLSSSGTSTTLSSFNLCFLLARVLATSSADAAGGDSDVQSGCGCDDAVPLSLSSHHHYQ